MRSDRPQLTNIGFHQRRGGLWWASVQRAPHEKDDGYGEPEHSIAWRRRKRADTAPFDATAIIEASRPTLSAAAEMNGRLYETVAALNSEYVGFVNRRLKEDLGLPQQFAACRTLEDVYGVYTGFFQRAVEQYQAEIEQMAKLGQTMASDTVNQLQDQASKARREMR